MTDPRRRIPSVDQLLGAPAVAPIVERWGRDRVAAALRDVQDALRGELSVGGGGPGASVADPEWYAARAGDALERADRPSLRPVINATGVVLHTNLGRAPLAAAAREAVSRAAGYAALEIDLETGDRGSRHTHCVALLRELTGAEDALVVNNNAAAVVLALNTLAAGREVVVSRGELVEIGGAFRVPEIIARSGARLREVGATNRTHPADYTAALGPETGAVLKVHRSNFRVEGFTAEVPAGTLATLARAARVPLVNDLGSGLILDPDMLGIPDEPTARRALDDGADALTMSGDKLLGGPQAGIILGRREVVARMRANPLSRALRPDKLTLAALEATLQLYRDPARALREVPVLRMLSEAPATLASRAERIRAALATAGIETTLVPGRSAVGGGALPGFEPATTLVAVPHGGQGADAVGRRLRLGEPSVVCRIREDRLVLDPRTVAEHEVDALVAALSAALDAGSAAAGGRAGGEP